MEMTLWVIGIIVIGAGCTSAAWKWGFDRLAKPADAYTEAIASAVARHHSLGLAQEETRLMTSIQETIKTELGHVVWERQARWKARQELYFDAARTFGELGQAFIVFRDRAVQFQNEGNSSSKITIDDMKSKTAAIIAAQTKLLRIIDLVPLIATDEVCDAVFDYTILIDTNAEDLEEEYDRKVQSLRRTLFAFQQAARADLGFAPLKRASERV